MKKDRERERKEDVSLYILRFANRLEFGNKTHQVSMTALRLVQRMKRDSMHTGRRPSGLCGAALLMAARLHEFNRSVSDIIKIVKVHESTLRKRLLEFGETPSSSLSLDEFMTVDLEEEQDPPSFKAARKKDQHDRFQKIIEGDEMGQNLTALQREIEKELNELSSKRKANHVKSSSVPISGNEEESENQALNNFVQKFTIEAIEECINKPGEEETGNVENQGLPPSFTTLGLSSNISTTTTTTTTTPTQEQTSLNVPDGELVADDLDDDELNQYIMTDREAKFKDSLWMKVNEDYLQRQKEREEKLAKEKECGKPEKKRKKYSSKKSKNAPAANSAGEAFEKMLQEKKMSTKINYDVLKSLMLPKTSETDNEDNKTTNVQSSSTTTMTSMTTTTTQPTNKREEKKSENHHHHHRIVGKSEETTKMDESESLMDDGDRDDDMDEGECDGATEQPSEISLSQLLNRHENGGDDDYGDNYDDEMEEDY
ncbi:transcription factor IIIB 70 kDa subunit, putative [Pediculus humanus corporis]|uniref:Transcription factor IIIB 70 kDa subunit, putative n=1 Tax=Pediculus humanus subsp. corporis TaxID=121224 RepID=E0VUM7_PEDHC|nr:transcription factor IIIB 70 kDa subunit, putative [Pediculus humanus corporis]EEB17083.1 transcription factor IIIB 70 kDa subunit, putative [Pediculus humanus corporis]